MKKNLLLFLFTLCFLFLLSEFFVRIFYPQSLQKSWKEQEPKFNVGVNKKNYFHEMHRIKNAKASYTFGKFRNRITIKGQELKNKPKVLVLGDSLTFGWLMQDEFTLIHKLQIKNMDYQFINSSTANWGSADYTIFSEIYCNEIKPKKIIIFLNTDDIDRGHLHFYLAKYFKLYNGQIVRNDNLSFKKTEELSELDKKIPFYLFLKSNSHFFMFIRNVVYDFINSTQIESEYNLINYYAGSTTIRDSEKIKEITDLNKNIFIKLKNISNKCGAQLSIFYTGWARVSEMDNNNPNKLFLLNAKDYFESINIPYFDNSNKMLDLYNNPKKYMISKFDFHPNKKGVDLIYNAINEDIKKVLSN